MVTFSTAEDERTKPDSICRTADVARGPRAWRHISFDISHVDADKCEALQALLDKHSKIFASSNVDFGGCGVIKNRIVTGNSPAVYQRAY